MFTETNGSRARKNRGASTASTRAGRAAPPPPWTTPDSPRKRASARAWTSAQALAAPKPRKLRPTPEPAADADALGGLGRDFVLAIGRSSAAAAVHEKALEEYLANQEAAGGARAGASREPRRRALRGAEIRGPRGRFQGRGARAKGGTHGFGVTGTAEVEVETDSAANQRLWLKRPQSGGAP